MNPDILERLVIDRCSGELSPDAAALLAAWLEREPSARERAAEIEATLRLAQCAVNELDDAPVMRLPLNWSRWLPRVAALAACFAAGLGAGLWLLHPPGLPPRAESPVPQAAVDYWSRRNFEFSAKSGPFQPLLEWKSPVRKPELRAPL